MSQTAVAASGRGDIRPAWALIYGHYHGLKGLPATFSGQYSDKVGVEGGGGDYGPNSGGFDQLGFGTLTATIAPVTSIVPMEHTHGLRSIGLEGGGMLIDIQGRSFNPGRRGPAIFSTLRDPGEFFE